MKYLESSTTLEYTVPERVQKLGGTLSGVYRSNGAAKGCPGFRSYQRTIRYYRQLTLADFII